MAYLSNCAAHSLKLLLFLSLLHPPCNCNGNIVIYGIVYYLQKVALKHLKCDQCVPIDKSIKTVCGEKMAWNMQLLIQRAGWMCKTHYFHCVGSSYVIEVDRKKSKSILIIHIFKYMFYGHTQENLHNCIDSSAVTLPHASKPWLSSNVPYLEKVRTPQPQKHF